jgi:CelD/BcsL family acetyltransferase involved in cellulose biosynthesis
MPSLDISLEPLAQVHDLASRWRALEARAQGSFFLGWTWMGSWLAATGAEPELLAVRSEGEDIALALIGRTMRLRPLGLVATLWLNQSGDATADRCFIEYNGLLTATDAPDGVEAAILDFLAARKDWRVLRLGGVAAGASLVNAGSHRRRTLVDESAAWFVDLHAVRAANGDYLSLLSANSRSQIRRSARDYGDGHAEPAPAANFTQAEDWLDEMQALNKERHDDNAWEDPGFRSFARALVLTGMERGEVELLRISHNGHLLGYLLNFLWRGQAMNYQSAFAPGLSAKAKPGLMCHAAAVSRYAAMGLDRYSLLAGKDRYKQSLATGHDVLQWWDLERFSPHLEAEHLLRRLLKRPVSA